MTTTQYTAAPNITAGLNRLRDELADMAVSELLAYADHCLDKVGDAVFNPDITNARRLAAELPYRHAAQQRGDRLVALPREDRALISAAHDYFVNLLFNQTP